MLRRFRGPKSCGLIVYLRRLTWPVSKTGVFNTCTQTSENHFSLPKYPGKTMDKKHNKRICCIFFQGRPWKPVEKRTDFLQYRMWSTSMVCLPTFTININHSNRKIYQHGSYGYGRLWLYKACVFTVRPLRFVFQADQHPIACSRTAPQVGM